MCLRLSLRCAMAEQDIHHRRCHHWRWLLFLFWFLLLFSFSIFCYIFFLLCLFDLGIGFLLVVGVWKMGFEAWLLMDLWVWMCVGVLMFVFWLGFWGCILINLWFVLWWHGHATVPPLKVAAVSLSVSLTVFFFYFLLYFSSSLFIWFRHWVSFGCWGLKNEIWGMVTDGSMGLDVLMFVFWLGFWDCILIDLWFILWWCGCLSVGVYVKSGCMGIDC